MLLIRFLIISICILYIVRSLARIFLPFLFQSVINKAQQGHQSGYSQQPPRQPREGSVKIDHMPQNKSKFPDTEGDFIDYEEIK